MFFESSLSDFDAHLRLRTMFLNQTFKAGQTASLLCPRPSHLSASAVFGCSPEGPRVLS